MSLAEVKQEALFPLDVCQYIDGSEAKEKCKDKINFESNIPNVQTSEKLNTDQWKIYKNSIYGFKVKYPSEWSLPQGEKGLEDEWDSRIIFKNSDAGSSYLGFEMIIYKNDLKSETDLQENTNQIQLAKTEIENPKEVCLSEQISFVKEDYLFRKTNLVNIKNEEYSIRIFPAYKNSIQTAEGENQFEYSVSSFVFERDPLPTIVRKPSIARPKILNAKLPAAFKVVGGQRVCDKKNDHPGKSKKNKGKHMDMECCLDPDEYPNPYCTYNNPKYQAILAKMKD